MSADYTDNLARFREIVNSKFDGTTFENGKGRLPEFPIKQTVNTEITAKAQIKDSQIASGRLTAEQEEEAKALEGVKRKLQKTWTTGLLEITETEEDGNGQERTAEDRSGKYAIKNDSGLYDPRTVTEQDVLELIYNSAFGKYDSDTLIPVRINTPQILIRSAFEDSNGKVMISNLPMVMYVGHVQQVTEESEGRDYGENKRPHEISPEDLVEIIKKMNAPADVVIQNNKKYAEIIHHKIGGKGKEIIAVVSVGENEKGYNINQEYLNGFSGGSYNIVVTVYPADSIEQYIKKYEPRSILKKNGDSQRSSASTVASLLNESPFFEGTVPQGKASVKSRDNAYEAYGRRAVVSEDTLNQWLKDYAASNPNYAQAYIAYMTPKQFLEQTIAFQRGGQIFYAVINRHTQRENTKKISKPKLMA